MSQPTWSDLERLQEAEKERLFYQELGSIQQEERFKSVEVLEEISMLTGKPLGLIAEELVEYVLADSYLNGAVCFVSSPKGEAQHDGPGEVFSDYYVVQNGYSDSYYGEIYTKIMDGIWLEVPFSC